MKRFILLAGLFLIYACSPSQRTLDTIPIKIETSKGSLNYTVELADEVEEVKTGLMGRHSIGKHDGMIFIAARPGPLSFWMKNTLIPLDMIFIREDRTIAMIAANRQPGDLTKVMPDEPVIAVLELEGGKSAEIGLDEGDRITWPAM